MKLLLFDLAMAPDSNQQNACRTQPCKYIKCRAIYRATLWIAHAIIHNIL